jgi:hypothetical protein
MQIGDVVASGSGLGRCSRDRGDGAACDRRWPPGDRAASSRLVAQRSVAVQARTREIGLSAGQRRRQFDVIILDVELGDGSARPDSVA